MKKTLCFASLLAPALGVLVSVAHAAPLPGGRPTGAAETLGVTEKQLAKNWTVQQIACTSPGNAVYPGETPSWTLQFVNKTDKPLAATGKVQVISYRTLTPGSDVFSTRMEKIADVSTVPVSVNLAANGFQDVVVKPKIPATFGAYALIVDMGAGGRDWASSFVRVPTPTLGKVQYPSFAMDLRPTTPQVMDLFQRLGVKGMRTEFNFLRKSDGNYDKGVADIDAMMKNLQAHDITAMLTMEGGGSDLMPMKTIRSFLNEKDEGNMQYPGDFVWEPKYDDDYQAWLKTVAGKWGWPKGPVNAVELWNEPWEGISISGWGADMIRYREIYEHMALGVEAARKEDGVQVLIGGACSSMNTEDKLFPDGDNKFLKWLDFTSIHYQPMAAWPALVPEWVNRKSPYGPVRVWDTESWIANTEDRVAGVIASMRAQGQSRTAGVFHDATYTPIDFQQMTAAGPKSAQVVHAWAPAAAIAATQKFIGERAFKGVLFKNGLPWVFQFSGLNNNADDSSLVVVGDLAGLYDREKSLFWNVQGIKERQKTEALKTQLAALPADATAEARKKISDQIKSSILDDASLTVDNKAGAFTLYDFYGNPLPNKGDKITVPLNGLGYFLRADGKKGSFALLLNAVQTSSIEGLEPVEIIAHDMTAPVGSAQSALGLSVTNILNKPVSGVLNVKLGNLTVTGMTQKLTLAAGETKMVSLHVNGTPSEDNIYPLSATFDAGRGLVARHDEEMHVNVIAHRTIDVDGNLDDWKNVLPQPMKSEGGGANLTEKAWYPFVKFDEKAGGVAASFMAYDENNFYFAAKVADNTPYDGNVRFETRDDDQYFYPAVSYSTPNAEGKRTEYKWPEGVRRFSYRKNPDMPTGNGTDNVQIGFNAIPLGQDGVLPNPSGTMPRFMAYKDTDYEYALNQVAPQYGGGTEIWRLIAPGVPRKHFYPRQPKAPVDGGPVKNGKLSITRNGNTRIVEASLPWSELPDVKKLLDAGMPIKFTCIVNNNGGAALELADHRSVSKLNSYAMHDYWNNHWANEVEFGWEK